MCICSLFAFFWFDVPKWGAHLCLSQFQLNWSAGLTNRLVCPFPAFTSRGYMQEGPEGQRSSRLFVKLVLISKKSPKGVLWDEKWIHQMLFVCSWSPQTKILDVNPEACDQVSQPCISLVCNFLPVVWKFSESKTTFQKSISEKKRESNEGHKRWSYVSSQIWHISILFALFCNGREMNVGWHSVRFMPTSAECTKCHRIQSDVCRDKSEQQDQWFLKTDLRGQNSICLRRKETKNLFNLKMIEEVWD